MKTLCSLSFWFTVRKCTDYIKAWWCRHAGDVD